MIMAINFTDFSKAPIQDSPLKGLFENALKGYKIGQEPARMRQEAEAKKTELEQKSLASSLQKKALEHYDEKFALEKRLTEANIAKAQRPAGLNSALAQAFKVRDQFKPGSDDWNKANAYIDKLGKSGGGIQFTQNPEGGFSVSIGGEGNQDSGNYIQGINVKKGETPVYDKDKKLIGIAKPPTAQESKEDYGTGFFNNMQPFLNESLGTYSGSGATQLYLDDVKNYESNEESRNRIDNFYTAKKLLAPATIKENISVAGPSTNTAIDKYQKSLDNSEVNKYIQKYGEFRLPLGYAKASGIKFNQILNTAREAGKSNAPAYRVHYLNSNYKPNESGSTQSSSQQPKTPSIPETIKTKEQFQAWVKTLKPEERAALKAQHVGER